jgi:tetraacyldisaccharide 4'-kinase
MTKISVQNIVQNHLYRRSLFSYLLYPLSLLYGILQAWRRKVHKKGYRSRCFVISIGNIVSGGSGKTPFTIFLANFLKQKDYKVAISHRGYKGSFEHSTVLISDRERIFFKAQLAGDEANLIAQKCSKIPVIAGKNRTKAIQLLESTFSDLQIIILDDSFQHLKVQHDFDILIFNSLGGIGNGFVLPAGILREPLSALRFSDCLIWQGREEPISNITNYQKPIFRTQYQISRIYDKLNKYIELEQFQQGKIALLSGIGLPASFENTVRSAGFDFVFHEKMPDHFDYQNQTFLPNLKAKLEKHNISYLFTTEKDAVKLINSDLPLFIVEISYQFTHFPEFETLLTKVLQNGIR